MPKTDDTVVEAGVYDGQDTAFYAKLAEEVIAFEPSPRNYAMSSSYLEHFDNITLLNEGLWKEKDQLQIRYGKNSDDDSFTEPDSGTTGMTEQVTVDSVENYYDKLNIDSIDFLKIEAEGVEPEIIEGIGAVDIPKIVVNVDRERNGQAVGTEVIEMLQSKGYTLVGMKTGCMLFFTSEPVKHDAFRNKPI
jgi:FkbM family methyltransferase